MNNDSLHTSGNFPLGEGVDFPLEKLMKTSHGEKPNQRMNFDFLFFKRTPPSSGWFSVESRLREKRGL